MEILPAVGIIALVTFALGMLLGIAFGKAFYSPDPDERHAGQDCVVSRRKHWD